MPGEQDKTNKNYKNHDASSCRSQETPSVKQTCNTNFAACPQAHQNTRLPYHLQCNDFSRNKSQTKAENKDSEGKQQNPPFTSRGSGPAAARPSNTCLPYIVPLDREQSQNGRNKSTVPLKKPIATAPNVGRESSERPFPPFETVERDGARGSSS